MPLPLEETCRFPEGELLCSRKRRSSSCRCSCRCSCSRICCCSCFSNRFFHQTCISSCSSCSSSRLSILGFMGLTFLGLVLVVFLFLLGGFLIYDDPQSSISLPFAYLPHQGRH